MAVGVGQVIRDRYGAQYAINRTSSVERMELLGMRATERPDEGMEPNEDANRAG